VDALRRRPNPPDLRWLGGHRGLEDRIVPAAGVPLRRLALRSLRSVGRDVHLALDPIRLGVSIPQAIALLVADRPAAIFTTGGYVSIPVLVAARLLGIPALLWEGNVMPGRSVRATAGLATVMAVSFSATCEAVGRGGSAGSRPCLETGTPIRDLGPVTFLGHEMPAALAAADLVIGRAGSSTLAEATAVGVPMIVIPYPHAGNHQRANARVLADAGAALVVEDAEFSAGTLLEAVSVLDDAARHARMSAAARSLGRPGAAAAVAAILVALAERRPLPSATDVVAIARSPLP